MKHFPHSTTTMQDDKVAELFQKFGYEGTGLFFAFLEKIAFHEKPVKTEVLKSQLGVRKKLLPCWQFMEEIGLISTKNQESFNENLLNYAGNYQIKSEKNRKKISEWRERQSVTNNVTGYEPESNPEQLNISKVKSIYMYKVDVQTLLDEKTLEAASMNQFTLTGKKNIDFIKAQWAVFLYERVNDAENSIPNERELKRYFLNWIRNKHPKNVNGKQSASDKRNAGAHSLLAGVKATASTFGKGEQHNAG